MVKTKNKMLIFIIFLVILIAVVVATVFKVKSVAIENENAKLTRFETIMSYDFVNNYPTTPNEVMDKYCYIISYLYSEEIKDEEIQPVVEKSRELMHFKTIAKTGVESQVQEVKNEREIIAGTNSFVTNVIHTPVKVDVQFPNYADCNVIQYTQSKNDLVGAYVLQMDNYQWKVYSWELKGTNVKDGK